MFAFLFSFVLSLEMENVEYENKWKPRSHLCTYEPVFIMHMRNSYLNARKQQNDRCRGRSKGAPTCGDNDTDEQNGYRKSNAVDTV